MLDGGRVASPATLRRAVLQELAEATGASVAASQGLVRLLDHGTTRLVRTTAVGAPTVVQALERTEGLDVNDLATDVAHAIPTQRFMSLREAEVRNRFRGPAWEGVDLTHALAAMITDPQGVVALVWLLRTRGAPAFGAAERAIASRQVARLGRVLARADREEPSYGAVRGTFVTDVDGGLRLGSVDLAGIAPDLARRLREAIPRVLRTSGAGRAQVGNLHLQITPMQGAGARAALLRIEPTRRVSASPVLALSPVKRRIVSFAVRGATVPEIARALDRSPETVRTHFKRIYEHVGVTSRVELASRARELWT